MSVSNGQLGNASTFNTAFLSRLSNSDTVAKIDLLNTDTTSLVDLQRIINEILSVQGHANQGASDATVNDYATNNLVTNGDNRKQAIEALDASFDVSAGHSHDGANSRKILASNLDTTGSTDNQILRSDGAGGSNWESLNVVSPVQTVSASGTFALADSESMTLKVVGDGGAVNASTTPFSGTPRDGMLIRVEGRDNSDTVTLLNSDVAGGCILNGDATLGKWDTITLRYDSTDERYIEQNRNF